MARNRPHIPLQVKVDACLILLGLDPKDVEWDHDPALELRRTAAEYYQDASREGVIPDANDPRFLRPRSKADHARKTNGPGGTKRITTRGGDHGDAAHLRRLTKKQEAFRARLLANAKKTVQAVTSELAADDGIPGHVRSIQTSRNEPPCHSLPREQWCDRDGPGGFMGHTCGPALAAAKAETVIQMTGPSVGARSWRKRRRKIPSRPFPKRKPGRRGA